MGIFQLWVVFFTIVRKEVVRIFRIWPQTLLPSMITTSLYFLIFGNIIGKHLNLVDGIEYKQYIMPGLIMMTIITNSYGNTVASFFSAKFQRNIEELIVSPTPRYIIILGYVCGGAIRGISNGILVYLVSIFFIGYVVPQHITLLVFITIVSSVIFSMAGLINGLFAKNFDDVSWVSSFILTPLSYLGGVFYSINNLPSIWKKISMINPISYCMDIFRYSFLSISSFEVMWPLFFITLFVVILFIITLSLMKHKLYK